MNRRSKEVNNGDPRDWIIHVGARCPDFIECERETTEQTASAERPRASFSLVLSQHPPSLRQARKAIGNVTDLLRQSRYYHNSFLSRPVQSSPALLLKRLRQGKRLSVEAVLLVPSAPVPASIFTSPVGSHSLSWRSQMQYAMRMPTRMPTSSSQNAPRHRPCNLRRSTLASFSTVSADMSCMAARRTRA